MPLQHGNVHYPTTGVFKVGDVVAGRYTVLQELGPGSTSTTYKARAADGSVVALKAMSFRAMTDWKQLELFEREASILRSLNHPCIPAYIDSFEVDTDDDRAYVLVQVLAVNNTCWSDLNTVLIQQELAQGQNLEQLLQGGWRVDEAEVVRIAKELLGVLGYLGGRRPPVVHRCVCAERTKSMMWQLKWVIACAQNTRAVVITSIP